MRKLSLICTIALCVLLVVMMLMPDRTNRPMAINGDTLGPDDETMSQYQARADTTLAMKDKDQHWALIAYNPAANAKQAAAPLAGHSIRVGSVLLGGGVMHAIPDPTAGHTLEDIFQNEITSTQEASQLPEAPTIPGVVVYATMDQLRQIRPHVFSIEALPADAVWGRIGVRNPPS